MSKKKKKFKNLEMKHITNQRYSWNDKITIPRIFLRWLAALVFWWLDRDVDENVDVDQKWSEES